MLTIGQASELTGRSEYAIRRLIKRLLETEKDTEKHISQEPITNGSFRYSIEKEYLLHHLPQPDATSQDHLAQPNMQGNTSPNGKPNPQGSIQNLQPDAQPYNQLAAKNEIIEVLKSQLQQRDEQLKKKDEQISQLLERGREANILLKGYQDKYLLDAPSMNQKPAKSTQSSDDAPHKIREKQPAKATSNSKPNKFKQQKSDKPKKKGFLSWF